jgi:hypothetical protein
MALDVTPLEERAIIEKIAESEVANSYKIDFPALLNECERVSPSSLVHNGGKLFEVFIIRNGKKKDKDLLVQRLQDQQPLVDVQKKNYIAAYTIPFWFFLVTCMQRICPRVGALLFVWTLCLEFYGLSRFGIQLLADGAVGQNIRTYDRWRLVYLRKYDAQISRMIEGNQAIFVYDNYNHQYGNPRLDLVRKEQMSLANYTVGGLSKYATFVDMKLRNSADGKILFSVPRLKKELNKYLPKFLNCLVKQFTDLKAKSGTSYEYYTSSKLAREQKQYVPIAAVPRPNRDDPPPLESTEKGVKNFYPWFVSKHNSASNEGHLNLMVTILVACRQIMATGKYGFVRMDITLFVQWLRVTVSSMKIT